VLYLRVNRRAVAILGRDSLWGGKNEYPNAPDLDAERRAARAKIEKWARGHGYGGYEVFACAANGGHTVDVVEFDSDEEI
jgi:hypothetical protein